MTQPASLGFNIIGVGSALPEKILTNNDLKEFMDTSDEWITERTGIKERRVGGTTSGLAIEASRAAIKDAGIDPQTIDHIILATTTPDYLCPGTAPIVAQELGLECGAFDVQAACSGWVYGLVTANGFLQQGAKRILLIGAETLDKITDFSDRTTGILFGNGAGAVILDAAPDASGGLLSWDLGSNGNHVDILYAKHGENFNMDGREVFRQAVQVIERTALITMEKAGVTADEISLIVPHQANIRIVDLAWRKLGFSLEKTAMVLEKTGNTSAASIPLALESAYSAGRIKEGDLVLFIGFGAGMTWASALVRWSSGKPQGDN